jgi:hypothetical protein
MLLCDLVLQKLLKEALTHRASIAVSATCRPGGPWVFDERHKSARAAHDPHRRERALGRASHSRKRASRCLRLRAKTFFPAKCNLRDFTKQLEAVTDLT